jgi:hypothetical protein
LDTFHGKQWLSAHLLLLSFATLGLLDPLYLLASVASPSTFGFLAASTNSLNSVIRLLYRELLLLHGKLLLWELLLRIPLLLRELLLRIPLLLRELLLLRIPLLLLRPLLLLLHHGIKLLLLPTIHAATPTTSAQLTECTSRHAQHATHKATTSSLLAASASSFLTATAASATQGLHSHTKHTATSATSLALLSTATACQGRFTQGHGHSTETASLAPSAFWYRDGFDRCHPHRSD